MRRFAALCFAATTACSWLGPSRVPDDVDRGLAAAGELEDAKYYALARDQLEAVAALTPEPDASDVRMRACRTYDLAGDHDAAKACFERRVRELREEPTPGDSDDAAEARELEGRSALAMADNDDALEAMILSYADTDAARRALIARLADAGEQAGCPAQIAVIDRLEPRVSAMLLRADLAVRRAQLLLDDCADAEAGLVAARRAEEVSAGTHYLDDAVFVHARAAETTNHSEEALKAYERIIDSESSAWPFGSNDSLFLDDAWMAHGLLLEKLGRKDEAIRSLNGLIDARPESRFHDDADRAIARMRGGA